MLVIWRDWKGEFHAFCGQQCQRHYKAWVADPNYPFEKAASTDVSFGCLWCVATSRWEWSGLARNRWQRPG